MVQQNPRPAAALRVVREDDPDRSWESVYRDNVALVYRYVVSRVGNRADAEDITAQVFLRSLPRLELSADGADIRGYLMTVARSAMADFWAAKYRIPVTRLHDAPAAQPTADDEPAGAAQRERVRAVLERLSERDRMILDLRFLCGYSIREVAAALGISQTNAKVTQWRALRHAAALFEEVP
jgi:RNA polymerase sigma-70 factor (ECF subfamily)